MKKLALAILTVSLGLPAMLTAGPRPVIVAPSPSGRPNVAPQQRLDTVPQSNGNFNPTFNNPGSIEEIRAELIRLGNRLNEISDSIANVQNDLDYFNGEVTKYRQYSISHPDPVKRAYFGDAAKRVTKLKITPLQNQLQRLQSEERSVMQQIQVLRSSR